MNEVEMLLLGVALGAIPSSELARLTVAAIGKRLGVEPREIRQYNAAANDDTDADT